MIRRKRKLGLWSNSTVAGTGWGESTFAELQWDKSRGAAFRWGVAGAVVGMLIGLVAFAPAAWLASAVSSATQQRLMLADARGTLWSGSAVMVLTGGADSRDASALPGRLEWSLSWKGLAFNLNLRHACCLNGTTLLTVRPGLGRMSVTLAAPAGGWVGQWPSAWLGGYGTPFNTLQLGGSLRMNSPGFVLESARGRWQLNGRADLEVLNASSRISTLDTLGSYRLSLSSDGTAGGNSQMVLSTLDGALQLSGAGTWGANGVRFRGEARAAPADEAALSNLLNIIGRREGARSVISIG